MAQAVGLESSSAPLSEENKAWMKNQLESYSTWQMNAAGLGRALYILAAVVFIAVVCFEQYNKRKERLSKLPPGPFQWPYLGSLPHLIRTVGLISSSRLREKITELAMKHGPLMFLQIVDTQIVVVSSGKIAKEVLVAHDAEFYFRPRCLVGKYLGFNSTSMTFAEGRNHWRLRQLCDKHLFLPECFASYGHIQKQEAAKLLHSVWEATQRGENIPVRDTVITFVRNSLCRMLLGTAHLDIENTSLEFNKETLITLLDEVFAAASGTTMIDLTPGLNWLDFHGREQKMKCLRRRLEKYFQEILDDRSQPLDRSEPEAFVDVLLSLKEDKTLSDEAIMGIFLDTLVGGTYSISASVEWALTELVRNPAMLEKVQIEISQVAGPHRIGEAMEFSQLSYFQAIVKETLRLHPAMPMSIPHMNKAATSLSSYEIPPNTSVLIDYAAIGRDSEIWPNPLDFDPTRFTNTDVASQIDSFKLLPFGYGRRICPGANLGLRYLQLGLAHLVQGFDWIPVEGQLPHDIDVKEAPGVVCFKSTPLILRAIPRLASALYEI